MANLPGATYLDDEYETGRDWGLHGSQMLRVAVTISRILTAGNTIALTP